MLVDIVCLPQEMVLFSSFPEELKCSGVIFSTPLTESARFQ